MAGHKKKLWYSEETPWFPKYFIGWIGIGNCGHRHLVSNFAYNSGGWITFEDILNERVAEDDTCNPHDFNVSVTLLSSNSEN